MAFEDYLGPIASGLGAVIGGPLGEFASEFGAALRPQAAPVASPNQPGPTPILSRVVANGGPAMGEDLPGQVGAGVAVRTPVAEMAGLAYDIYGGADYAASAKERAFHQLFAKGYIPLESEPGRQLLMQGHKPCKVRVRVGPNGQAVTLAAFKFGVKGKCRRKRVNLTRGRLADAAWVHRKLSGQVKLAKKFARSSVKILGACAPRSRAPCVAVRKTTCKKR